MIKKFIISDMHFGHRAIIRYEKRPFEDISEMNDFIVEQWNKEVNKNDIVYVLGDVSFYGKELTKKIMSKLKGRKILIMGNHDRGRSRIWWLDAGFEQVIETPILIDEWFLLSHEPIYLCAEMPYVNIHGHIHSKVMEVEGVNRYVNVSVEHHNYTPILFDDIKKKFEFPKSEEY